MANPIKDGQVVNDKMFLSPAMANTQVLTGDLTLTDESPEIQYLDANGASRNINLPAVANTNHIFFIYNSASSAFNLVIKSGVTIIVTLTQGQSALVMSNGVTWISFSGGGSVGGLTKIATVSLSIDGTISFSNIPGTYISLLLLVTARGINAATGENLTIQFNGDVAANYDYAVVYGGATFPPAQTSGLAVAAPVMGFITGANAPANFFGSESITIPNYANTSFDKMATGIGGEVTSATADAAFNAFVQWRSTAAITSILLFGGNVTNLKAGSTATLWGMS